MPAFTTEAIVLGKAEFKESDLLVTFYSDEMGKIKGVAKGAKKSKRRFGANLELLAHIRIHGFFRRGAELARIDHADLMESFDSLRGDLLAFARGCYLAEWIDGCLAYGQSLPGLLKLALRVLNHLQGPQADAMLRVFEAKLLQMAGYRPRLTSCISCGGLIGGAVEVGFDVQRGGVLCRGCASASTNKMTLSLGTIRVLREALRVDVSRIHRLAFTGRSMREAKALLRALYECHLGRPLRSADFLEQLGPNGNHC